MKQSIAACTAKEAKCPMLAQPICPWVNHANGLSTPPPLHTSVIYRHFRGLSLATAESLCLFPFLHLVPRAVQTSSRQCDPGACNGYLLARVIYAQRNQRQEEVRTRLDANATYWYHVLTDNLPVSRLVFQCSSFRLEHSNICHALARHLACNDYKRNRDDIVCIDTCHVSNP